MIERIVNVERMEHAVALFGNFDENIKIVEKEYGVTILCRGTEVKIAGEEEQVDKARRAVEGLLAILEKGEALNDQNVRYVISMVAEGTEDKLREIVSASPPRENLFVLRPWGRSAMWMRFRTTPLF